MQDGVHLVLERIKAGIGHRLSVSYCIAFRSFLILSYHIQLRNDTKYDIVFHA
ncbi:hypothetical protein SEA_FORZA_65 [Gordonia phage Forza]|uniref:Uncharacterized protein n=1 Tax=Gordonia phage Forza TaxID=2571247 RepID=A0A650EZG2_9CAUD|nr:hypothetical protein PP303_gp065 [Gordonia phage Forza]QGT55058.1 hypothetical protein SEA_FORZA_65 [Gordonia phage Forza]